MDDDVPGVLVTADLDLLPTASGGRRGPIYSGYFPMTVFARQGAEPQYVGLAVLHWTESDAVAPGESGEATIHYAPAARPYLEELAVNAGVTFDLWEGRTIGHGRIKSIRDQPW